jgi:hypothetical protein
MQAQEALAELSKQFDVGTMKIRAIKELRSMAPGLSLKKAKTAVDEYIDGEVSLEEVLKDLQRREASAGALPVPDAKERKRARDRERMHRKRAEAKAESVPDRELVRVDPDQGHILSSPPDPAMEGVTVEITWAALQHLLDNGQGAGVKQMTLGGRFVQTDTA